MALSNEHWNKIMEALPFKIPPDRNVLDPNKMLLVFKENWELFSDERQLDTYIETQRLVEKRAARDVQQTALDQLDADIKELEK